MSEPLKSVHVRVTAQLYEQLELMAECQRRDIANLAQKLLECAICGEWYVFEKRATKLIGFANDAVDGVHRSKKSSAGFVYVIRHGDLFKIGKAKDPAKRINGMSLPDEPEVICTIPTEDRTATERELHRKFKQYRHRREWFKLPADVIEGLRHGSTIR